MSTRCTVNVQIGRVSASSVQMYHHSDGYPSHMLALIATAYRAWKRGDRPNIFKAVNYILAADRAGYELEPGAPEHGDLEYRYVVMPRDNRWDVNVFKVNSAGYETIIASSTAARLVRMIDAVNESALTVV